MFLGSLLDSLCSQRTWVLLSDLASNHCFQDCTHLGELLPPHFLFVKPRWLISTSQSFFWSKWRKRRLRKWLKMKLERSGLIMRSLCTVPKTLNLTQRTREPVEACEQQRQGSTYELETSGWFISLLQFLSHGNRNLERWTKRCRTTGKLQLSSAQADRSFISPTLPEESSLSFLSVPLGFPLLHFQLFLLVMPSAK